MSKRFEHTLYLRRNADSIEHTRNVQHHLSLRKCKLIMQINTLKTAIYPLGWLKFKRPSVDEM